MELVPEFHDTYQTGQFQVTQSVVILTVVIGWCSPGSPFPLLYLLVPPYKNGNPE